MKNPTRRETRLLKAVLREMRRNMEPTDQERRIMGATPEGEKVLMVLTPPMPLEEPEPIDLHPEIPGKTMQIQRFQP